MKNLSLFFTISMISVQSFAQLAESYPNDLGIENDPNVLYVEKFEDGMTNILTRYTDKKNTDGMSLDSDVPEGSLGQNSLKMTSITNGVNNGGHLFKKFTPGFDSTVYIRYYIKYPSISKGYFHHEGVWFGGYNPATNWPNPRAGTCGLGDRRLSISYEPIWQREDQTGMDTYNYWGDMKSFNDGSTCYGNIMVSEGRSGYGEPPKDTIPLVEFDQWMCIEVMVKLNNPVTAHNGALKIWQNGVQIGSWGPGFPNGHWLKDKWYNNPTDPPFQGFRWRTDPELIINWVWLEFYHDDPNAPSSYLKFDHLVMAKEYIGPIYNPTSAIINNQDDISKIMFYPNPSTGIYSVMNLDLTSKITIVNVNGVQIFSGISIEGLLTIDLSSSPKGVYFAKVEKDNNIIEIRKLIIR